MAKRNKILKLVDDPVQCVPYKAPIISLRLYINEEDPQSTITFNYNHAKNQLMAFDTVTL